VRLLVVVLLSQLAATGFAVSAVIQRHVARRAIAGGGLSRLPGLRLVAPLLGDPVWLLGWLTNASGFLLGAVALHLGRVDLVQPLMVTELLYTLLAGAVAEHRRLSRGVLVAALVLMAGLGCLLAARPDPTAAGTGSGLLVPVLVGAALAALLVVAALGRPPTANSVLLGMAAGLLVGLSGSLTKVVFAQLVGPGVAATAGSWQGWTLAATTGIGLLLGQEAFAAGRLAPPTVALTLTTPAVATVLGLVVFGQSLPTDAGHRAGLVAAGLLVALGVSLLARAESAAQRGDLGQDGGSEPVGVDQPVVGDDAQAQVVPDPQRADHQRRLRGEG
jgi:hypothetical protein